MALAALGIIELRKNVTELSVRQKAAKLFEESFKANPRNPIALKYLAEHYFFQQKYDITKDLCKVGLETLGKGE